MSIDFRCGECGKRYAVSDNLAGRKAKCKACGAMMVVPANAEPAGVPATTSTAVAAPPPKPKMAVPPPIPARAKAPVPPPMPKRVKPLPPPVVSDPFDNPEALMALESSGAPAAPGYAPSGYSASAYAPSAYADSAYASPAQSAYLPPLAAPGYAPANAGDYVRIPGEELIDRFGAWVPVGLFALLLIVALGRGISAVSAMGTRLHSTDVAKAQAMGRVCGFALGTAIAVAGIGAPLCLLGVFIASRIMKFKNRPALYLKCLAVVCVPWALAMVLDGFELGGGTKSIGFMLGLPLAIGVLWLLLRLKPVPFAVAGGIAAALGFGLPTLIATLMPKSTPVASVLSSGTAAHPRNNRSGLPETTIEERLADLSDALNAYAAAHGGVYPATIADLGQRDLLRGYDRKRDGNFTIAFRPMDTFKSPLPPKLLVAYDLLPEKDENGEQLTIALFGDGHVETLDGNGWDRARKASSAAEQEAPMWLASDTSTPRGAVVAWFLARLRGDAEALKARSYGASDDLLQAAAEQAAADRALIDAAARRFPSTDDSEPRPYKTDDQFAREILQIVCRGQVKITGDSATIGDRDPFELKKVDGQWRFNAAPMFNNPTPVQTQLGIFIYHISTRAYKELTQELAEGKYADWPSVKQAVLDKLRTAQRADPELQACARANPGPLPTFAMTDPWHLMQAKAGDVPVIQFPPFSSAGWNTGGTFPQPKPPPVVSEPPSAFNGITNPRPGMTNLRPSPRNPILPPNTKKTDMPGGRGGGPYATPSPNGGPITGFRYCLGKWAGQVVLRRFYPIFEGATDPRRLPPGDATGSITAREGYVVGGLVVDYDNTNVIALRVIFVRRNGTVIDARDQYQSDWIGTPAGAHQETLAGNGETLTGTFGREGLNLAAIGFLMPPE